MRTAPVRTGGRGAALAVLALGLAASLGAAPAAGQPAPATAPASTPASVVTGFTDVPPDHPFAEEIAWLVAEGITAGYADGTFRPTAPVSRQAMATFLTRLHDVPVPLCTASPFPDVPVAGEHCGAVAVVAAGGVMTGYSDGLFRPSAALSRQAAPAVLARAGGAPPLPACTAPPFPDVTLANEFCPVITVMAGAGITTGYPDGLYHPTAPVSRQALAVWLHRMHADDGGPGGPILEPVD